MAERVEKIMAAGTAEVNHRGEVVEIELPGWFTGAADGFFDEEELLTHCREHGILHATLQAGFAQFIIELRAKAKPKALPPTEKGGDPIHQSIVEHFDDGQERVLEWKPEPREPAEDAVTKAAKLLKGLTEAQKDALREAGLI